MKSGELVHHSAGCMCTHCDVASVGGDGEDVGGPIECADCNPSAIVAETDILDLQRRILLTEGMEGVSITN